MDPRILNMIKKYGKKYDNAVERYCDDNSGDVKCDVCGRAPLIECYGWDEYDVCTQCYEKAFPDPTKPTAPVKPVECRTQMRDVQFTTNMEDTQFTTNMEDTQFTTDMEDSRYYEERQQRRKEKKAKEQKRLADYNDPSVANIVNSEEPAATYMVDSQFSPNVDSQFSPNVDSQFSPNVDSQFSPNVDSQFASDDVDPWYRPNNVRINDGSSLHIEENTRVGATHDNDVEDSDRDMDGYNNHANNRRGKFVADDSYAN